MFKSNIPESTTFLQENLKILKSSNIKLYQVVLEWLQRNKSNKINKNKLMGYSNFRSFGLDTHVLKAPVIFIGAEQIDKINGMDYSKILEWKDFDDDGVKKSLSPERSITFRKEMGERAGILIEPDIEVFSSVLPFIKTDILKRIYIIISDDPDYIRNVISKIELAYFNFVEASVSVGRGFRLREKDFFDSIIGYIKKRIEEEKASALTESIFRRLWWRNVRKNVKNFQNSIYKTKRLINRFNGHAVLVGSGPWLEDKVEVLKDISKYCPVFSLLPSVDFLLVNGIIPDVVLTSDPGFGNRYRLCRSAKTILFAALTTDPVLLRYWNGKVLFFSHSTDADKEQHNIYDALIKIPMEGTSAIVLIRLAEMLGFSDLLLFGYDFCFRGIKDHHRGAGFENYFIEKSTRLSTFYSLKMGHLLSDLILKTKLLDGDEAYTSKKLLLYRGWLEEHKGNTRVYRLNNGLDIKGIPFIDGVDLSKRKGGSFKNVSSCKDKKINGYSFEEYTFKLLGEPLRF